MSSFDKGADCVIITPLFSGTYANFQMKRTLFFLIFISSLVGLSARESRGEVYGKFPTGLLQLEKKYPYYLYVPTEYSPEKSWPVLFLLGKRGEEPKDVISPWVDWANQNQFIVLVPSVFPREGTVPTEVDEWLFRVKEEVAQRYRIDPSRILLMGSEYGSQYAAYLGLNYPDKFSSVVLIQGPLPGAFEKLMKLTSNSRKQASFYLAPDAQGEGFSRAKEWALKLEKKGYPVTFEPMKADENFSAVRDRLTQWLRKESEARSILKEKPRKKFKDKADHFFHDFFTI